MEKDTTHFAESVKQLRKSLGLSQAEFGKRIGVAKTTVCNYELGNSKPTNSTLQNMSFEFKMPPSYFLDDPTESDRKELQRIYGTSIPLFRNTDIDSLIGMSQVQIVQSISIPTNFRHSGDSCIATTVADNSMNRLGIKVGTCIIIDRDAPLSDNAIVAAVYKGKLTLRRYHDTAYGRYISTESTKMPASLERETLPTKDFFIIGTVTSMIVDTKYM